MLLHLSRAFFSSRANAFLCGKAETAVETRQVFHRIRVIGDNLHKAGWSWGCVSAIDSEGRTIWIVDAHGYGKRFIVCADELLTAFLELETAIRT
jgi:hypothetical protein